MRAEYPIVVAPVAGGRVQAPCFDCFGIGTAVSGVSQAIGNVAAAHEQAGAARDAAKMSADAATHAADVQSQSAAATLDFTRQQAQAEAQAAEVNRQANYNQWAGHERGVSSIGELLGLGGKEIPGYVPGVVPNFAAPAPGGGPSAPAGPRPGGLVPTVGDIVQPPQPGGALGALALGGARMGAALAPGAMPGSADLAAFETRLGGNTGVVNPYAPKLQPDGTYAMPGAPVLSIDDYLRA